MSKPLNFANPPTYVNDASAPGGLTDNTIAPVVLPRFVDELPFYEGNTTEFMDKIKKTRNQCENNKNMFINQGGCEGENFDSCITNATKDAAICKEHVSNIGTRTLEREYNAIQSKIKILEDEVQNLNSSKVTTKDYEIINAELNGLKHEKEEITNKLLVCNDIGLFRGFCPGFAIFVLILSVILLFSAYTIYSTIGELIKLAPTKLKISMFLFILACIAGIVTSSMQLESVFKQ